MGIEGFRAYRLHPDAGNPREVTFADQWQRMNVAPNVPLIPLLVPDCTDRDEQVAATITQWLGTNVGMSYLVNVVVANPEILNQLVIGWAQRNAEDYGPEVEEVLPDRISIGKRTWRAIKLILRILTFDQAAWREFRYGDRGKSTQTEAR